MADTSANEVQIDRLEYKLYGVTDAEITAVEGANENRRRISPGTATERPTRRTASGFRRSRRLYGAIGQSARFAGSGAPLLHRLLQQDEKIAKLGSGP